MGRNVFTPVIAAALLLVFAGYIAVRAGLAGARFLPSLNDPAPALASAQPVSGEPPPRLARRVIVVIVDGLRLRESFGLHYLDRLRRQGVDAAAESHYPTFSRPNHAAIVTGVAPRDSGIRTNHYRRPANIDSLMQRARDRGLAAGFVGNYSDGLPELFSRPIEPSEDPEEYEGEWQNVFDQAFFTTWRGGFVDAAQTLLEQDFALVVLLPGDVDAAGHEFGAESEEYLEAARFVDRELERALKHVDLDRDAILITSDHGHTDWGGHGGVEPEVLEVPLVMAGAGIREGAAITNVKLIDVAPTAAALLGLPPPGHSTGRTLTEALELDDTTQARIERLDQLRIVRNATISAAARDAGAARIARTRVTRIPMVIGLCVLMVAIVIAGRRVHALHIDWRVLFIALPAFPLTYYALLGLFGQSFSPSMISERGDVQNILFRFGLISTAVHIMASWVALRGRVVLRDRLAAANALTLCGLFTGLVPAALAWAMVHAPFVDVPGPRLMVLVPATYVAVACYAVASAATITLEIVVFFARAVDPRVRLRRLERAAALERARLERERG